MVMSNIQKKIANKFMRMTIGSHIKGYIKKGIHPTTEQVMQNINQSALNTLAQYGYTHEEISKVVEDIIRRQKCKE